MANFKEKIADAKAEAKRFLRRVQEWEDQNGKVNSSATTRYGSAIENGALKRSSMDLTRSLANLRKSQWT